MDIGKNEYYYLENGLLVFTAKYLLERGYCCKNGCRHCPYGFNKNATKLKDAKDYKAGSDAEK
jgi:Family of unknown function (DUF5522)